jgi:hypothetical protein
MTLIEKEIINNRLCYYYHGIDFDMIRNHPKDGSGGFIVFLIESFINEIKNQNRDRKLVSILQKQDFVPFDTEEMAHDFVGIYQYEGVGLNTMLDVVKKQIREYGNDMFSDTNEYH